MCTAIDESAEDKSEDKSGDVTQIVKEYLNGDTLQNLVDKVRSWMTLDDFNRIPPSNNLVL